MSACEIVTDYSADTMVTDNEYRTYLLTDVAAVCVEIERITGSAQDIEGVIDFNDTVHIVQTRPQV